MVTTKANGLEIVVGAESGVVYRRTGVNKMPRDFITWQDFNEYRIWIHSRQTDHGFKPVSMDIQTLGKERHPNGVDSTEAKARVALAAIAPADLSSARFGHTQMRNLPIGHIMEQNSILISNEQARSHGKTDRKLNLVDSEKEEYRVLNVAINKSGKKVAELTKDMRASKSDSIFIAYLYMLLAASGNQKAASQTAKMLEIDPKFVYTALRNARKYGWLTTEGIGSSGGALTPSGKKEFEKVGRERYEEFLKLWMKEFK